MNRNESSRLGDLQSEGNLGNERNRRSERSRGSEAERNRPEGLRERGRMSEEMEGGEDSAPSDTHDNNDARTGRDR